MLNRKTIFILPIILVGLFAFGCAGRKMPPVAVATLPGAPDLFKRGQILDLKSSKAISFQELVDTLSTKELIFVGEVHDNAEHHLIQVQILQALQACCGPVAVGMEFFQKPKQEALDRYINGETDEDTFLREVDWKGSWGFDYHFYRPLLMLAKEHHSRILALNAPRAVVKKVARGGLESLDPDDRNLIAREVDLTNEAHRAYVREVFGRHANDNLKKFDFFYQAQCVWDDTMAERIADYLEANRTKMIVFVGNGHIVNHFGIPDRTIRRYSASMATIMPYTLKKKVSLDANMADYVWLTRK